MIAEPGRYFSTGCMDLVTSIIGCRLNNKTYFNFSPLRENSQSDTNAMELVENCYYINDGIYGSLSNILHEKTIYRVYCVHKRRRNASESNMKKFPSAVFGPTCDSIDCLSRCVNLPLLEIGDYLLFYNVGAYSNATSTSFNGFRTKKYFYIWKD